MSDMTYNESDDGAAPGGLRARIAAALGWPERDTYQFSFQALRDLVRPVSAKLAHELTVAIQSGSYIANEDAHDDDFEPHEHGYARNSYETEAGTRMLATHCFVCGKPLRDPVSIESGIGPICASKFGAFAMTGPVDPTALSAALETAPEKLREIVRAKFESEGAKAALSAAIHAAGNQWEQRTSDHGHYVGATMEIADALGYHGTARALQAVFIEGGKFDENGERVGGGKPKGIVVSDLGDGRWKIELPFIDNKAVWFGVMNALKAVGLRNQKIGNLWEASFKAGEREWLLVLNAMVGKLSGTLGVLPDGETFIVPVEPLPVPALPQAPTGAPTSATDELPEPLPEITKGMKVTLKDGREMIVGWVGPGRIGVSETGRGRYEFMGTNEVRTAASKPAEVKQVEEITDKPVAKEVRARELPTAMFPYQREAAMWLDQKGSGLLALDLGLGKTLCAISASDAPVTVVCPATLRINWVREVAKWRPDLTAVSLGTHKDWASKAKRPELFREALKANVVVVNYDILSGDILDGLIERGCETLICDEAHALKELKVGYKKDDKTGEWKPSIGGSKRAQNVWKLAQHAKRRFMLTGTPMINGRPYELFPLLHLVDPREWRSFRTYCQRYCDPQVVHIGRGKTATTYKGASNLTELNERIQGKFMLRMMKDDVLDLPEKSRRSTKVTLDEDTSKHYKRAAGEFLAWVRDNGGIEAAMRAKRNEVLVQLTALRRLCAIGKVPAVAEAALEFSNSGKPLVIMAHHREAIAAMVAALTEAGLKVGQIVGGTTDAQKNRDKDHFQDGIPADAPPEQRDYLDVVVCSIKTAGMGITLTRASDMIFLERDWRPFDLVQAEDRIYRIGTTNKVIITYYDAAGTVDDMIAKLLASKISTAAKVIDGEDLSETEAQNRVLGEMFGEDVAGLTPNQGYADLPEWADPES